MILTGFLIFKFNKFFKHAITRIITTVFCILFFLVISFITFVAFAIFSEQYDDPPSGRYHHVHAAIKNTCYLDPEKRNCPTNVDEIIKLDSQRFGPLLSKAALTYQYIPEENRFTLIIRNTNPLYTEDEVAIFDSRLLQSGKSSPGYGYGYDFYETKILKCGDKYELIDKPPFPGPWSEIN